MQAENRYSESELVAEFAELFPNGFCGSDVMAEVAPERWEASPLLAVNHPPLEQVFRERCQVHRNLLSLRRSNDTAPLAPEPTLEETQREFRETPIVPERELRELVGQCLWDVFSDNHEVVAADSRILDLGSFRGSAGFLADFLNQRVETSQYDYMDFYMGTIWVAQRADLSPVYQMIFRRLDRRKLDWVYHFPRLMAVDLRPLKETLQPEKNPDWENYDPSRSFAEEQEQREHDERLRELRESLDDGYREAVEEAVKRPPPATVLAYQSIYGRLPQGWPPVT